MERRFKEDGNDDEELVTDALATALALLAQSSIASNASL